MAFPEQVKSAVRRRAHLRCCLCRILGVEIHHVIPQAEGGPDTEDNAAPLCPSCHETYGANSTKRKFILEARDVWYDLCAKQTAFPVEELRAISTALGRVVTKEDLARLSIQNSSYVLGMPSAATPPWEQLRYSFARDEFVHPRIVRELVGWISDPSATIVSVDLAAANRSNRFFGEFSIERGDGPPHVKWTSDDSDESFSYVHVATSPSGIQMLQCHDWTGGTGVWTWLCLLALETDRSLHERRGELFARDRVLLKTLGSIALGDRYSGEIAYRDGFVEVGPDVGWFHRGEAAVKRIPIR